jgi:hypothetical protein
MIKKVKQTYEPTGGTKALKGLTFIYAILAVLFASALGFYFTIG